MADRDIPEEMVEAVERAWPSVWFDHTDWRTKIRALLSAALAGRQVVDLPAPDMRHARALVRYWNRNPETLPQEERFALQKLADVREARRLAAGSRSGEG